jgi:hypothetical protein
MDSGLAGTLVTVSYSLGSLVVGGLITYVRNKITTLKTTIDLQKQTIDVLKHQAERLEISTEIQRSIADAISPATSSTKNVGRK